VFVVVMFLLFILAQLMYLVFDNRFGFYEIFFLFSIILLFSFAYFLYVLLMAFQKETMKIVLLSMIVMVGYQVFQFSTFMLGYWELAHVLNEVDIEKRVVFYKIVGNLLGSPGFLSESGMVALYLGPTFGILLIFERLNIYKANKFTLITIFLGLLLTISGGAFLELFFLTILIFILNLRNFNFTHFALMGLAILTVAFLLYTNPGYHFLITDRIESFSTGKSGRLEGFREIMDIFWNGNIWMGIAPKSGRFFDADQNMLLPMLLTDHGLIGTFFFGLILFLPYINALFAPKRALLLIPYTGFVVHLFLAYGSFLWSYLWVVYILVLYGFSAKTEKSVAMKPMLNPNLSV